MKKLLTLCVCLACSTWAHADQGVVTTFAQQAGIISGAAQACGMDVTVFNNRASEVIAALSSSDGDRLAGMTTLQKSMDDARRMEAASQKITCVQVVQDFSSLPLLKDDYKEAVVDKLRLGQPTPTTGPGVVNPSDVPPSVGPAAAPSRVPAIGNSLVSPGAPAANSSALASPGTPGNSNSLVSPGMPNSSNPQVTSPITPMAAPSPVPAIGNALVSPPTPPPAAVTPAAPSTQIPPSTELNPSSQLSQQSFVTANDDVGTSSANIRAQQNSTAVLNNIAVVPPPPPPPQQATSGAQT